MPGPADRERCQDESQNDERESKIAMQIPRFSIEKHRSAQPEAQNARKGGDDRGMDDVMQCPGSRWRSAPRLLCKTSLKSKSS